jgi:uncharacterized protein (DUF2141 family)
MIRTSPFLGLLSIALLACIPAGTGLVCAAQVDSSTETTCTLRIRVDGFRNTKGNLGTVVFRSSDGWPENLEKSFRHGPAPIDPGTKTGVAEWKLPPGDYGIAVIHDENSNHHLDRNFLGVPKEGFGFANNPHVLLSAPPIKDALVHVACPSTEVSIHLQYK